MNRLVYTPITSLPRSLDRLERESSAAGFSMMARLRREWEAGVMRFSGQGEILLGAFRGHDLVGTAGLSRDPYLDDPSVGRLRHVYVLEQERGAGIATALVRQILALAPDHFTSLRLSTARAGPFYDRLGFLRAEGEHVTHRMPLTQSGSASTASIWSSDSPK